jgi:hypothetical protein
MKNHLLRPLWCVLAAIILILIARYFIVPDDFGVHGEGFTYGYHRLSNVDEWRNFKVKYQGREYCLECHEENVETISNSKHREIQCENCHGPAIDHPDDPETLNIDTGRKLCLRCHAALPYPDNPRSRIASIDGAVHNPGLDCIECHAPHNPDLEEGS